MIVNILLSIYFQLFVFVNGDSRNIIFQNAEIESVIAKYHNGFIIENPEMVVSVLSNSFTMFNGNFSGNPADWQAHMFLSGDDLKAWPSEFLKFAGPYENKFEVVHMSIRGNAALVVTLETGSNKFREWQDEQVTWLLGKEAKGWLITGYFIKDIKNPE